MRPPKRRPQCDLTCYITVLGKQTQQNSSNYTDNLTNHLDCWVTCLDHSCTCRYNNTAYCSLPVLHFFPPFEKSTPSSIKILLNRLTSFSAQQALCRSLFVWSLSGKNICIINPIGHNLHIAFITLPRSSLLFPSPCSASVSPSCFSSYSPPLLSTSVL